MATGRSRRRNRGAPPIAFSLTAARRPSRARPSLVGLAVAGPEDQPRPVRGGGLVDVQAQSGVDVGDGAVGVEGPLLVVLPVAGPDDHLGAVGGALVVGVEAL